MTSFFSPVTILLFAVLSLSLSTPDKEIFPEGVEIKRDREYVGEALYGFMNGGSELFLDYGFEHLRALDVIYEGEEYSVEIYKMPSTKDAFGIYSLHTHRCIIADSIAPIDCHSKYQLQFISVERYVSIVFKKPVEGAKQGAIDLMNFIRMKYEDSTGSDTKQITDTILPEEFRSKEEPYSGRVVFVRGPVAVNNSLGVMKEYIEDIDHFEIWSYRPSMDKKRNILLIQNPGREDSERRMFEL